MTFRWDQARPGDDRIITLKLLDRLSQHADNPAPGHR
jgi:hypothetical protein